MSKKKPVQTAHKERKSSLSYRMTSKAYSELMRRCKGKIQDVKNEILRGLSLPQSFKEIVKLDKETGEIREVLIESSFVDEVVDIIVVD